MAMKTKSKGREPLNHPAAASAPMGPGQPDRRAISEQAYRIYEARGGRPGNPIMDWLEAERALQGRAQG